MLNSLLKIVSIALLFSFVVGLSGTNIAVAAQQNAKDKIAHAKVGEVITTVDNDNGQQFDIKKGSDGKVFLTNHNKDTLTLDLNSIVLPQDIDSKDICYWGVFAVIVLVGAAIMWMLNMLGFTFVVDIIVVILLQLLERGVFGKVDVTDILEQISVKNSELNQLITEYSTVENQLKELRKKEEGLYKQEANLERQMRGMSKSDPAYKNLLKEVKEVKKLIGSTSDEMMEKMISKSALGVRIGGTRTTVKELEISLETARNVWQTGRLATAAKAMTYILEGLTGVAILIVADIVANKACSSLGNDKPKEDPEDQPVKVDPIPGKKIKLPKGRLEDFPIVKNPTKQPIEDYPPLPVHPGELFNKCFIDDANKLYCRVEIPINNFKN